MHLGNTTTVPAMHWPEVIQNLNVSQHAPAGMPAQAIILKPLSAVCSGQTRPPLLRLRLQAQGVNTVRILAGLLSFGFTSGQSACTSWGSLLRSHRNRTIHEQA